MSSDKYTPQAGDRVRHRAWSDGYVDVLSIDGNDLFGRDECGDADVFTFGPNWVKVETPAPLPERWITLAHDGDVGGSYGIQYEATTMASSLDRLAVIHVYTDADGVDHAEIERVTR